MSDLISYQKIPGAPAQGGRGAPPALDLIYNYLNEPGLRGMSDLTLGGTFPTEIFRLSKIAFGKQFWYCYDRKNEKVFLALEDAYYGWSRKMTVKQIPSLPDNDVLHRSGITFAFDDKHYDRTNKTDVDRFMRSHVDPPRASRTINSRDVVRLGKEFVKTFGGKQRRKEYCYYPLGYFENFQLETKRCILDEFLAQGKFKYIRYFFGLDKTPGHKANRMRIILFPVDNKSKVHPIIFGGGGSGSQASFPPPP
ncbi:MAG TPA: hypothetical protein DGG95_14880 [Cytophagales bacterium]|jgi:hypothetical protein|nr:hypothetical protein [Cytophagales bacterium]